jgi:hypothetical protein
MALHVNLFVLASVGESDTESTDRRAAGGVVLSANVAGE